MKHVFFVEQPYSFPILRPLEQAALARGDQVRWFLFGLPGADFIDPATILSTTKDVCDFKPDSVVAPGTWVPHFFPGLKVQIFHGFGIEKSGHFRIRGHFDLYCTHGPLTTREFTRRQARHPHFHVVETGWPKLDPWANRMRPPGRAAAPCRVLYAPTFSPRLSSAKLLLGPWREFVRNPEFEVTAKFHPLQDPDTIASYRQISGMRLDSPDDILQVISANDLVVSDTSSVVAEALYLGVPVLAFRPKESGSHFREFSDPDRLADELLAMRRDYEIEAARGKKFAGEIHPYADGRSSLRILDAIHGVATGAKPRKSKPANLLRKYKIAKKMVHYR